MRKIILTGDRPTGRLHIGHYVGSLRRRVELQNSGEFDEINIMIADAQALTDNFDNPGKVRENIMEVAIDYLSCGIDPEKTTILIQSQIPELTELTFYYADLVTVARLQRNPTVKTEVGMRGFGASIPVGFFTYPISQAADITAFKATTVPAGEDQEPMIEQTREIVRSFNRIYGCDTLVEPEIMLPPNQASMRLPGTDGKEKMSKSLGNCIYLSDPAAEVKKKVMSMYTDPDHLRVEDPGKLEGNTVFTYLDAFCKDEYFAEYAPEYANLQEMKDHYTRGGLGDVKVKKFLNNVLQETLEPIRQKRAELEKNIPYVYEVLRKGTEAAEEKAARTLDEVRHDMMIDYFSGDEWLVSQEKKFAEQRAAADAADVRVKRQRAAEARKKAKAGAGQN
ncbi:MAG: tryptophan--tRNA ligase [Lachnospiraceae bacterium]|nr:tryptophan--tRNA ligase [Lachnospiraceae bacterium]